MPDRRPPAADLLRTRFNAGALDDLADGQLLQWTLAREGEAAELAFAALFERHGPMVLRACRAVLRDEHAAQDAAQAVFLVLVRKAGRLWVRDSLGPWLHQVAYRVASAARTADARRRRHEAGAATPEARAAVWPDDLEQAIHEEVERLPTTYRTAVVLCCLEGQTLADAARRLGWPLGTVQSRLARARLRLRDRLARRGVLPNTFAFGAALAGGTARAAVPPALAEATARAATTFAAGGGAGSPAVAALVNLTLKGTLAAKWQAGIAVALAAFAVTAGVGVWAAHGPGGPAAGVAATDPAALDGTWVLTGHERDGKRDAGPFGKEEAEFAGDRLVVREEGREVLNGTVHVRAGEAPNGITLAITAGQEQGQTMLGIYALDGDELKICWGNKERPAGFDTAPGSGRMLWILKRATK